MRWILGYIDLIEVYLLWIKYEVDILLKVGISSYPPHTKATQFFYIITVDPPREYSRNSFYWLL